MINPNNLQRNTYNVPRVYLDFKKLNRKAVKITYPSGDVDGEGFSIVTPWNGEAWNWPVRLFYEQYVLETDLLNAKQENGLPSLDDCKYLQIIMS